MEYPDERIRKALNQKQNEECKRMDVGFYIKEQFYELEETNLLEERMSIKLPKLFVDMPLEVAKLKYPMEQRPQIIKTNEETDINFTFQLLDISLTEEYIEEMVQSLKTAIKNYQPCNVFYDSKTEQLENVHVSWYDFKSNGLDGKIYNVMYGVVIDGKYMQGSFNCKFKDASVWKPVALYIIRSIRDLTRG